MAVGNTAIWRVRPSGANTNGGGYDAGIAGAGTDYSQQNAAQATGTNGSGSGTTTFTDATAAAFTSAMVGNAINITGQGFYFVVTFTSATQVVVDRALGTFSGATWHLGGAWADFWTNPASTGPLVPGNRVRVLGSGTPNPSSYTLDYTLPNSSVTLAAGDSTNGRIVFENDPGTPGYKAPPDTTGGMPVVKIQASSVLNIQTNTFAGFWWVWVASSASNPLSTGSSNADFYFGNVFDVFQTGSARMFSSGGQHFVFIGNEIFSSLGGTSSGTSIVFCNSAMHYIEGNNFHDFSGSSIYAQNRVTAMYNIFAKTGDAGILLENSSAMVIKNNTFDGIVAGHGLFIDSTDNAAAVVMNNIFSNITGAGKAAIFCQAGTATQNTAIIVIADYNSFYNNTANYSSINAGSHDTALLVTPYVAQSTENYTLA